MLCDACRLISAGQQGFEYQTGPTCFRLAVPIVGSARVVYERGSTVSSVLPALLTRALHFAETRMRASP